MSNAEHEPTNQPAENAEFEPIGYTIAATFHPQLKLLKAKGFEFAQRLSSIIDPSGVQLEEKMWVFSQPLGATVGGQFQITIQPNALIIDAAHPDHNEEWFEYRYHLILKEFFKSHKPQVILNSTAIIRGTVQIDGDAREFLWRNVAQIDQNRINQLERPVHLFGIRLFMPPYQKPAPTGAAKRKGKGAANPEMVGWMVEVKAESLMEDPRKLFLEAKCDWVVPQQWTEQTVKAIEGHLADASNYMKHKLIPFLKNEGS